MSEAADIATERRLRELEYGASFASQNAAIPTLLRIIDSLRLKAASSRLRAVQAEVTLEAERARRAEDDEWWKQEYPRMKARVVEGAHRLAWEWCFKATAMREALLAARRIAIETNGACEDCGEPATGFQVDSHPTRDTEELLVFATCDGHIGPDDAREEYATAGDVRVIDKAIVMLNVDVEAVNRDVDILNALAERAMKVAGVALNEQPPITFSAGTRTDDETLRWLAPPHPIQPLYTDSDGAVRFKENAIVRFLLDAGPFNMNHIAEREFTVEDREQFAQLIGYSLCGFGELSYARGETYARAEARKRVDVPSNVRVDEETWAADSGVPGEVCLAGVPIGKFTSGDCYTGDVADEARARMAAASPEMLRVLRAIEWSDNDGCLVCPSCDYGKPRHDDGCALKAALDKAEAPR